MKQCRAPAAIATTAALLWSIALASAPIARAQATLIAGLGGPADFGTDVLAPDDDSISAMIELEAAFPGGISLFGTTYTQLWVNTNGNVSFTSALPTYTPDAFPGAPQPMIAPWWADVDTRGVVDAEPVGQNRVYWSLRAGELIVTWYLVGYFSRHVDLRNSFQLVLRRIEDTPGAVQIEFRYARCEWTTGDSSGGTGGLGGRPAHAGFEVGARHLVLPASGTMGVLASACLGSNVDMEGVWQFRSDALASSCGNGFREEGEECDDGNTVAGDGCEDCMLDAVDAGVDAGSLDAGPRDAGPPDAGMRRDAGPPRYDVYGGGCSVLAPAAAGEQGIAMRSTVPRASLALVLALSTMVAQRRRRRAAVARRAGIALR